MTTSGLRQRMRLPELFRNARLLPPPKPRFLSLWMNFTAENWASNVLTKLLVEALSTTITSKLMTLHQRFEAVEAVHHIFVWVVDHNEDRNCCHWFTQLNSKLRVFRVLYPVRRFCQAHRHSSVYGVRRLGELTVHYAAVNVSPAFISATTKRERRKTLLVFSFSVTP